MSGELASAVAAVDSVCTTAKQLINKTHVEQASHHFLHPHPGEKTERGGNLSAWDREGREGEKTVWF